MCKQFKHHQPETKLFHGIELEKLYLFILKDWGPHYNTVWDENEF